MTNKSTNPHQKYAHEMVAAVAKDMAACWYEEAAHDNDFYAFYPKQEAFMQREWKRFIAAAKAQLAVMLSMPTTSERDKELIFDALVKHASLPGNMDRRVSAAMIAEGHVPQLNGTVH